MTALTFAPNYCCTSVEKPKSIDEKVNARVNTACHKHTLVVMVFYVIFCKTVASARRWLERVQILSENFITRSDAMFTLVLRIQYCASHIVRNVHARNLRQR